jgi:hypothetical protein
MYWDNRICANCVSDSFLKTEISKSASTTHECDYCGMVRPTIAMEELASRCETVLDTFYECSSLTDAVIHFDRQPAGEDLSSLLSSLVGTSNQASEELAEVLTDMWFDNSSQEHKFGEDPWFNEAQGAASQLSFEWARMERSLQEENRFFNPAAMLLLEKVFGPILDDRTHEGQSVIVEVGPGRTIEDLFRARSFETEEEVIAALEHPERFLGPPPAGLGDPGRMNAKGVPLFYGATHARTAVAEVRPPVGAKVLVGKFKVVRNLKLLDLHQLGAITLLPEWSKFSPQTVERALRKNFLKSLTGRLAMPIMPCSADKDYLITQAIADFLATHPKLDLDGILFPSAQDSRAKSDKSIRNVVLFRKASTVLRSGGDYAGTAEATLWEYEDESMWPCPQIFSKQGPVDERPVMRSAQGEPIAALELDRGTIELCEIQGVEFLTHSQKVIHRV